MGKSRALTVLEKKDAPEPTVAGIIDELVARATEAKRKLKTYNQEQIDTIVRAMALAGVENHVELARLAWEETGKGVYEDKITKNLFATEYIYNDIKHAKTVGLIEENEEEGYMKIAEPIGVIAGVTPVTNPTSTTMFKSLIALKTGNPIIFSFHPQALKSSIAAAKVMLAAAVAAGAPADCISWIEQPSLEATNLLMKNQGISLILATGGAGMVEAAYSSGKPALGVGPGNVPCYIEKSANLRQAVTDLILSKTFDNGMICASEQAVVIDREVEAGVKKLMAENGCYFLNPAETAALSKVAIDEKRQGMSPAVVGQSAVKIAELAGLMVPAETKILVAELEGVGPEFPLSREKLSPILACYIVSDYQEGIKRCEEMTEFGGLGHSAVIHSNNREVINDFAQRVRAGRLLVNSPSTHGAIGDLYNTNTPSLTLGCGSMGKNSTTDNVSIGNLINIKRVALRKERMKWFKVPPKVYFEYGSLQYLAKLKGKNAVIVTDPLMVKLDYVDKVLYHLKKTGMDYQIFSEVEPDPSVETVEKGCRLMQDFEPDVIIALGGGSAIDAAKGMWLFYECPETDFGHLRLKFADIRKRTFPFPTLGRKATFVAIPTTSGTGSEVTAFAVITDKQKKIKYPLTDYELTPDIAILDPELVLTVPKSVTADTGMDVLTHAIEAYVSVMASDYTDALAEKAIKLVFEYLPLAYQDGKHKEAREKMHNASCLAGMAFTNAFLGLNHSMAHILGGKFHLPHGRANAILLPYVIQYNAAEPSKFAAFPQYGFYQAPERYAEIARFLGLPAATTEEGVTSLIQAIRNLNSEFGIPLSLQETGISREEFQREVAEMADIAFNDQCTGANPRMPLVAEIEELYLQAYEGKGLSVQKEAC